MSWVGEITVKKEIVCVFEVAEHWEAEDKEDAIRMAELEFWDYMLTDGGGFGDEFTMTVKEGLPG